MSNPTDLKTVYAQELVSFQLFCLTLSGPYTESEARDAWQALSDGDRKSFRNGGIEFLDRLGEVGLEVRVTAIKATTQAIEFLLTVPPRIAYELPEPAKEPETQPQITLPNSGRSV